MDQIELAEKLIAIHSDAMPYYRIRYELYKLLNLDFDLFFTEDIINRKNNTYYGIAPNDDDYKYHFHMRHKNVLIKQGHHSIPNRYDLNSEYWCTNIYFCCGYNLIILNPFYKDIYIYIRNLYHYMFKTIFSTKEFSDEQLKIINKIVSIQRNIPYTDLSNNFKEVMEKYHE